MHSLRLLRVTYAGQVQQSLRDTFGLVAYHLLNMPDNFYRQIRQFFAELSTHCISGQLPYAFARIGFASYNIEAAAVSTVTCPYGKQATYDHAGR